MNIADKRNINIKGRNIVIIGFGKSGAAAGKLAKYLGANVLISESKSNSKIISLSKKIESYGIDTELGGHSEKIFNADLERVQFPFSAYLKKNEYEKPSYIRVYSTDLIVND